MKLTLTYECHLIESRHVYDCLDTDKEEEYKLSFIKRIYYDNDVIPYVGFSREFLKPAYFHHLDCLVQDISKFNCGQCHGKTHVYYTLVQVKRNWTLRSVAKAILFIVRLTNTYISSFLNQENGDLRL